MKNFNLTAADSIQLLVLLRSFLNKLLVKFSDISINQKNLSNSEYVKSFENEVEDIFKSAGPLGLSEKGLTHRETQVFDLFIDGYNQREVALKLNIHESTVSRHKKSILKKFNSSSMSALVREKRKG
jgi:DNA-binding NarL/FixJ family response regulator